MAISLRDLALDLNSRVNPWRAAIEMPELPPYSILYDETEDCLYITSDGKCRLFATRREIDDNKTPDAKWFRDRAHYIMRDWENLAIPFRAASNL